MIDSSRASRPIDEDGRIFDDDDTDLTESQEFDKALAQGSESLQAGDAAGARGLLEKALRHKPRNQRARNLLGLSLFKLGELEKAESLYRGLIEDHPADPTLRVNLGLVFLKSGASSDAVRCFETALDLQPDHSKAQNYLGLALAQKGEHAKAREWFLKCGNTQMAERMAAALLASPIRQVAEDAEQAIAGDGQPFRSALEPEKRVGEQPAAAAQGGDAAAPSPAEPSAESVADGSLPGPGPGSKWVATLPATATPPSPPISFVNATEVRPVPKALGRIPVRPSRPGGTEEIEGLHRPDHAVLADAHAAAALAAEPGHPVADAGVPGPEAGLAGAPATDGDSAAAAPAAAAADPTAAPPAARDGAVPDPAAPAADQAGAAAPAPETARSPEVLMSHAGKSDPALRAVSVPPTALSAYTSSRRMEVPTGEGGFVIGNTEVVIQVHGEMLTRLDGLVASWGSASMKPELKRFRGKATDKPFGEGARRMLRAAGDGRYVIAREGRCFTALELGDEPAYFREEILFAFEESLVFENGRVPSKTGTDLHLVHLRGRGKLLLVTAGSPRSMEVAKGDPLRIPMDQLVGWHGPLIQPRLVPIVEEAPELGVALELSGEGRALVDAPEGR